MKKTGRTYTIGAVSKMTGIEKHKLRHWCYRYLPHIQRINIGGAQYREFTEQDVELIRKIRGYREKGYMPKVAIEKVRKELNE